MSSKTQNDSHKFFDPDHKDPNSRAHAIFRIEYFSTIENKETSEYIRAPILAEAIEIWRNSLKRFDIAIPDDFRIRNVSELKP